jgi:hypothetical protein
LILNIDDYISIPPYVFRARSYFLKEWGLFARLFLADFLLGLIFDPEAEAFFQTVRGYDPEDRGTVFT